MANRFQQINQFISQIKPTVFTEAGIGDFSVTEKLIDQLVIANSNVTYFGMGSGDSISEYLDKLSKLQLKYENLSFFVIDLSKEVDVAVNYMVNDKPVKLSDATIVFCNNINETNDFAGCIQAFQNSPCIILNNVFQTDNPEILRKSVNPLLPQIKHIVLPVVDTVMEGIDLVNVQLAVTGSIVQNISVNGENTPVQQDNGSNNQVNIKTKNAVPNEQIQKHVEENILFARTMGIKEVMPCQIHNGVAYMIGGAPSYKTPDKLKLIKKALKEPNHYIFSSKTALPFLLENHIKPYACILLDPREHIPTFVDKINKDVIYFVASQCNTNTLPALVAQGAKVFLYHAAVNAGEADVLKKMKSPSPLVGGGSTSVTRGIGLLQLMGFHYFKLFGLDSSYPSKPEKVHGYNQEKPSIEVNMSDNGTNTSIGQKYWTDPELIAQCNDIEMIMKNWLNIKLENYSEGMMADMFKHLMQHRRQFKDFIRN